MPMLFGKLVVGPDCGNVGPLLKQWGYPVFSVDDTSHIGDFILEALRMAKNGQGIHNRNRQLCEYGNAVVADILYEVYKSVTN